MTSSTEKTEFLHEVESQLTQTIDLAISDAAKDAIVEKIAQSMGVNHKRMMRKIDVCVVPPLALLYFLAFLDRVNISNAKIYGMEAALGLHGNQFATALTVFFAPYVVLEVGSNYMLKIIKPHQWLSALLLLFGVVTICMAYANNFGGLVTCRFFLGVFEAGTFPAIFYIIANFYAPGEALRRFTFFFNCVCLAGGCAGALAYRINDLDGVHGLSSWQWIYVIEGSMTAGLAFVLYFLITDFPEEARFLSETERAFLKKKLAVYSGHSGFEIKQTWGDVAKVFKEPILYICALTYFCFIVPCYAYAFFAPTVISQLGYTAMEAQSHSIYPWLATMGFALIVAFISDRVKHRTCFGVFVTLVAVVGLSMILASENPNVRYGGCFLTAMGIFTGMPILICWMSLNLNGHTRKSVATAFVIGFGNIGGIVSSFLFPNGDRPKFTMGLSVSLGFTAAAAVLLLVFTAYLHYSNKKKQTPEYQAKWETFDEREKIMKGDLRPDFKYML